MMSYTGWPPPALISAPVAAGTVTTTAVSLPAEPADNSPSVVDTLSRSLSAELRSRDLLGTRPYRTAETLQINISFYLPLLVLIAMVQFHQMAKIV